MLNTPLPIETSAPPEVLDSRFLTQGEFLEDGLSSGGVGIWRWKIDTNALQWTKNLEGVHHLPVGSFDGTLSSFQRDIHPEDARDVWLKIKTAIETNSAYRAVYRTAAREAQPELWIETLGAVVTDATGARFLTGVCQDVTVRIHNDQQLNRRLFQQRAIAHFGSFALSEPHLKKVMDEAVQIAADVLDVPLTKILQFADGADHLILRAGRGWAEGLVGHGIVGIEMSSQAGFTLMSAAPVIVTDLLIETRFNGPALLHDHQVRSGISVVIPGATERPFGVFGIHSRELRAFDETDSQFLQSLANIVAGASRQATALDHRMLLVREMAHRSGNMLQLVSSIANQTFNSGADLDQVKKSFAERISALGRSNHLIASNGWTSTPFAQLVSETLKPFGPRVDAKGRDVILPAELCFDLGLVLHECATNSVKYGTLGRDNGLVDLTWSAEVDAKGQRRFKFAWRESTLPTKSSSAGTGFGSKLLTGLIERKWGGTVVYPEGPHYSITLSIPVSI